jgi:hypothetical protein
LLSFVASRPLSFLPSFFSSVMSFFAVLSSPSSYLFDSIELRPSGLMLKACGCNSGSVAHHLARKHIDVISVQRRTPWLLFLVSVALLVGGGYMHASVTADKYERNYATMQGIGTALMVLGVLLLLSALITACTSTLMIRTSSGGSFIRTSCTRPDEQEKLLAWLYGGEDVGAGARGGMVPLRPMNSQSQQVQQQQQDSGVPYASVVPASQPPTFAYASGPGPSAYALPQQQQQQSPPSHAQYPGQAEAYARMS